MNGTEAPEATISVWFQFAERKSVCKINMFDIKSRQLFVDGGGAVFRGKSKLLCQFWRKLQNPTGIPDSALLGGKRVAKLIESIKNSFATHRTREAAATTTKNFARILIQF